jgi:hypothetical protein
MTLLESTVTKLYSSNNELEAERDAQRVKLAMHRFGSSHKVTSPTAKVDDDKVLALTKSWHQGRKTEEEEGGSSSGGSDDEESEMFFDKNNAVADRGSSIGGDGDSRLGRALQRFGSSYQTSSTWKDAGVDKASGANDDSESDGENGAFFFEQAQGSQAGVGDDRLGRAMKRFRSQHSNVGAAVDDAPRGAAASEAGKAAGVAGAGSDKSSEYSNSTEEDLEFFPA